MREVTLATHCVLRIRIMYSGLLGCEAYCVLRIRITYYGFEAQSVLRIAYPYYVLRL